MFPKKGRFTVSATINYGEPMNPTPESFAAWYHDQKLPAPAGLIRALEEGAGK